MSQIWTGYNDVSNVTAISYENANNRVLCGGPLTTAKLTRSCADLYPDAIKYGQFATDIALEVSERCKGLALEHHKCDKMRTPKARDVGCHAKTSVTPRRGCPCVCPRACICLLGQRRARAALVLPAHAYRAATRVPARWGQIVPRNSAISVSASGGNGTNGTQGRYKRMRFSYDRCPIRRRNSYDSDHTLAPSGTKAGLESPKPLRPQLTGQD